MSDLAQSGLLKELLKEVKDIKKRVIRVERAIESEKLTADDLGEIKKSEAEIKTGKYKTMEQVKKELGME